MALVRFHNHFSSCRHKLRLAKQPRKRILDIISPKTTSPPTLRPTHLRLLQHFLRTSSRVTCLNTNRPTSSTPITSSSTTLIDQILEDSSNCMISDASILSSALSSCASFRDLRGGSQYHCLAITTGFASNAYIGSSLITLYGKSGELDDARKVFYEMPVRNVVTWTAIISGFAQDCRVDICLELFSVMRNSTLKPNDFTFASLLSACTGSGALGHGTSAHCQVIQMGLHSYLRVANALISMYCKCGSVKDALYIFDDMNGKDIVSWNAMISGYALHGLTMQAIELFEKMKMHGMRPDSLTFLGVLSACRHAGFLERGRNYFSSMVEYGVNPELDHYSCLIDLLGRAGLIEEARDIILRMPLSPNAVIWGSLLSSCRLHGNVWIGIQAAEQRLIMEPGCSATYVQLAKLYASVRYWDDVARVRKLMKDTGLKTSPGYSWIEIKNRVYRFRAEDGSNTKAAQIVSVLDCLVDHMKTLEYGPKIIN